MEYLWQALGKKLLIVPNKYSSSFNWEKVWPYCERLNTCHIYYSFLLLLNHKKHNNFSVFYRSTTRNSMRDFSTQCVFHFQLSTYFIWPTSILARSVMTTTVVSLYIDGCSHKFKYWVLAVNRHFGETNMNVRSSRSHTIFRMVCPWVLLKCLVPLETVPLLHIFLVLLLSIYHSKHAKDFVFLKIIPGDWKQGKGHHF